MGYELHIVRNDACWREQAGGGISLTEWSSLVADDETMRMEAVAEIELPDGTLLRYENEGLAVWSECVGNERGGKQRWFDFRHNAIVVKHPDRDVLAKMLDIAAKLDAKVVGDEGEEYKSPTDLGV